MGKEKKKKGERRRIILISVFRITRIHYVRVGVLYYFIILLFCIE